MRIVGQREKPETAIVVTCRLVLGVYEKTNDSGAVGDLQHPAHGTDDHKRAQPLTLSRSGYRQAREFHAVGLGGVLLCVAWRQGIGDDFRKAHRHITQDFRGRLIIDQYLRPRQAFVEVSPGGVSQVVVEIRVAAVEAFPAVSAA